MTDNKDETASADVGLHGHKPALQVICLGSGGGPTEDNVTGLLVRATASDWAKGSLLAVDAGSHLAPIVKILERYFPSVSGGPEGTNANERGVVSPGSSPGGHEPVKPEPTTLSIGPFAGLKFPNASARANALHILHNFVNTYLITHPHLDHLSGFAINTAAFHATSRPKTVAALPSTVDAIKTHIFNDIIWPNLTDEDGGVGFVTFQRLKEGGDVMVGEGEGRGYIDVSDGLGVKSFKVSHGVCTKSPPSHHHRGSVPNIHEGIQPPYHGSVTGEAASNMARSMSGTGPFSTPGTPGITPRSTFYNGNLPSPRLAATDHGHKSCVVDSTAFFVRDTESNREVLIFGDVEPDSLSLSPRNYYVWQEAARKVAHDLLGGIFIECSYDDSQADAVLFGHMNPKHLITELQTLAGMVVDARTARHLEKAGKKRKRSGPNGLEVTAMHAVGESDQKRSRSLAGRSALAKDSRRSSVPDHAMTNTTTQRTPSISADSTSQISPEHGDLSKESGQDPTSPKSVRLATNSGAPAASLAEMPLNGIKVIIIHVKDTMKDGPRVKDNILTQLRHYEQRLQAEGQGLGCEFIVSEDGEHYWF